MNSIRNKGKIFPKEIGGLFNTKILRDFPQEIITYTSSGKFVKSYIMSNLNFHSKVGGNSKNE